MANAPTAPADPQVRAARTAGRTANVARKSEVDHTRRQLLLGADVLKDSHPEVSGTLRALARPFGHRMLTVDRNTPRVADDAVNVSIMVPEYLRKAIQDAAVDGADSDDVKVQDLLGRVLSAKIPLVVSGDLTVREIPREPRGSGVTKVNLSVPVAGQAVEDLRAALPALGERLGFKGKAAIGSVAFRLLLDEYGLEYEPASSESAGLAQMQLHVPPRLAAEIRARLALVDADLRQLVEEGFGKVLAGEWQPFKIPKAAKGSAYERDILPVRVDPALVDGVRAKCPELKQRLGYRVTPPSIAIDWLISELGLEDLADAEYGITAE